MSIEVVKRIPNATSYVAQEDGKIIVGEVANVEGNLDRVQRMRQAGINNQTMGVCHASIPLPVLAAWCNNLGIDIAEAAADDAILDRFLADNHGKFLVKGGWQ